MFSYKIHGLNFKSDIPLKDQQEPLQPEHVVIQECPKDFLPSSPRETHPLLSQDGIERAHLGLHEDETLSVHYEHCADFYWRKNVLFYQKLNSDERLFKAILTTQILPLVSSLWRVTLHGGVFAKNGEAVIYLGAEGVGKSTLTAHLMKRGFDILSDDVAAIETRPRSIVVYPGLPEVRLFEDCRHHFFSEAQPPARKLCKDVIATARLPQRTYQLKALFFLDPIQGPSKTIAQPLRANERFEHLIQNQFRWNVWSPKALTHEFDVISQLSECVPMTQLTYSKTFEALDWVEKTMTKSFYESAAQLSFS